MSKLEKPSETHDAEADTKPSELVGEDLVVGYGGSDEPVIPGESVVAEPGKVTALVGPNGSGKSTLLNALADQVNPTDGTVLVDGEEVASLSEKETARRVGILSQEAVSPDNITVGELVKHGRYPHRGFFEEMSQEDYEAVDEAIGMAGVEQLRNRELSSLSGGQKQLAWIAMVLAQDTDILLLDEPTTFLDMRHQLEVMRVVETLRDESETTVVVVLHNINQAVRYSDRLVALRDGEVIARGEPEKVVTEELLKEVFGIEARIEEVCGEIQVQPVRPMN